MKKLTKNEKVTLLQPCLLKKLMIGLLMTQGFSTPLEALTFPLPARGSDVVGQIQTTRVRRGETLSMIGRRYDIGLIEMIEANPTVDPWVLPLGTTIIIPSQFILPHGPRVGLVLNLAEMRLYYFDQNAGTVTTHPLGIGAKRSPSPIGHSTIIGKKKDPAWYPPASIRKEHLAKNDVLPPFVAGGTPENPLGRYALYMTNQGFASKGTYLIHGTNRPAGIGVRATHGCIRLYPEDIESLFYKVPVGTPIRIIHEPYKVGWHNNRLYLEAHKPLSEKQFAGKTKLQYLTTTIQKCIQEKYLINWNNAKRAAEIGQGYPIQID